MLLRKFFNERRKRPGAGRPKGVIDGTKGIRLEEQLQNMSRTPLEYMISIEQSSNITRT